MGKMTPLADFYRTAMLEAMARGLGDVPSGPVVTDPQEMEQLRAAVWIAKSSGIRGGEPPFEAPPPHVVMDRRWSAPRWAAIRTFWEGIRLGMSATGAARVVTHVRHAVRRDLGIDVGARVGTAEALAASPEERAALYRQCRLRTLRREVGRYDWVDQELRIGGVFHDHYHVCHVMDERELAICRVSQARGRAKREVLLAKIAGLASQ